MQLPLLQPVQVQVTTKPRSLLRSAICISSLVFVCGFDFIVEFIANFFSFTKVRASDIFETPAVLLLLGLTGTAFVQFVRGLFRENKFAGDQICRLLIVVGALAAFFYKDDAALLGDRLFFWTNETSFEEKVAAEGSDRAVLLSGRSSSNTYHVFIYTGGISLPVDRRLSMSEKTSLNPSLLDEIKGCPIEARRLKDRFYVVHVYCGLG
jgi:hypothetical protein